MKRPNRTLPMLAALAFGAFSGGLLLNPLPSQAAPLITVAGQAAAAQQQSSAKGQLTTPPADEVSQGGQRTISAQEAFNLVSQEAEKGQAQAMHVLGTFYDQGLGVAKNHSKALEWYLKASDANFPAGAYAVGLAYEVGRGVPASRESAITYFQKAADLKVTEASYKLASLSMAGVPPKADDKKALDYLKAAGVTGAKAQEALGNFYENGVGLAPNYTQAFNWYKKAADAGLAEALFRVGTCYELGLGTAADGPKAIASFETAAKKKMANASYKLAGLYMSDSVVKADPKKAMEYMHAAVRDGHAAAANELGVIYLQGLLGQAVDTDKALEMFTKSADLGNTEGMKNIAVLYKNGLGRKADPGKALQWYLIAQRAGYQAEGIQSLIDELKKSMKADQIKQSESDAEKWITAFISKNQR